MSTADKIAEARALIEPLTGHEAGPLRDTRIPSCSGRIIANQDGKHIGSAFGVDNARVFAAAPALRDTVAALADLADALAQENERLRSALHEIDVRVERVDEWLPDETTDALRMELRAALKRTRAALGDAP